jgi:hypothetical protein
MRPRHAFSHPELQLPFEHVENSPVRVVSEPDRAAASGKSRPICLKE